MRLLAIDPGGHHLGLALSDPDGIVARPLTTITHTSRNADVACILALAAEHRVEKIIIGYPLQEDETESPMMRHAQRLAEALRALSPLPVELFDETLTSHEAQTALVASGKNRRDRREQIHAVAAATLLQSYLDSHA